VVIVTALNESTVELAALDYLRQLGWSTAFGPSIAPDSPGAERTS
jgi:type I restriction enzyme R subunit